MRTPPKPAGFHWHIKKRVIRPDGKPSCRWCTGPCEKPRRTFCSDRCVGEWMFRKDPKVFRQRVHDRDKGVCARCGFDTRDVSLERLNDQLYLTDLAARRPGEDWRNWKRAVEVRPDGSLFPREHWLELISKASAWLTEHKVGQDQPPWQADHVIEVADGGDWFDLSNIQTLCTPCHREKSAASARARAARRRAAKSV